MKQTKEEAFGMRSEPGQPEWSQNIWFRFMSDLAIKLTKGT